MQLIGDMARALVLRENQVRLRTEMDQLAVEVATGFVRDPARHLGGDASGLLAIDRTLARLEAFRVNTAEAELLTGAMQAALDGVQSRSEALAQTLISTELTPSDSLLQTLSADAADALDRVLTGLNSSVAGRYLFAGAATDTPPLPDSDTVLASLRATVAGLPDVTSVDAALDAFFAPGGGFETTLYQGSTTDIAPFRLGENETADLRIRADHAALRDVLKPLAKAALAADPGTGFSLDTQIDLLGSAGRDLLGAVKPVVDLRAGLGLLEARIEDTATRNAAERTATSLARLELVGAEPYETAARYENIRGQLESLYAITARSQRLSLAEYL